MIIEFNIENCFSFKDKVSFSMLASNIKERFPETNVFDIKNQKLLKTSVIYGANGSGKTNLFKALLFMRNFVLLSANSVVENPINPPIFLFSTETQELPCFLELVFISSGIQYRYGFKLNKASVLSEWLYYVPKDREVKLFVRNEQNIELGRQFEKEGKPRRDQVNENSLFLSVLAQRNGDMSKGIVKWFANINMVFSSGDILEQSWRGFILNQINKNDAYVQNNILPFLKATDLSIENIVPEKMDIPESVLNTMSDNIKKSTLGGIVIKTSHKKYDNKNNYVGDVPIDLMSQESSGTVKLFYMAAPIISVLKNGGVLLIDEMDARLHIDILKLISNLFHSNNDNKLNAQLIFNVQDVSLLEEKIFRRDQIWFIKKDKYGKSNIYSLVDYKVRNDSSYKKDYLNGLYGALPNIGIEEIYSVLDS